MAVMSPDEAPAITVRPAFQLTAIPSFPWETLVFWIWAAGAGLLLLRVGAGTLWRRRWRAGARPCQDRAALVLWQQIDRKSEGRLLVSADCRVPLTWGKLVILPVQALAWPRENLAAALRHEAAHLERTDARYRTLGEIAAAFFWPQPLVWLARRLWHRTQEQSCDDAVLRSGSDPANYAELLCSAARMWTRPATGGLSMAQPSSLEYRLRAVLDPGCPRSPCTPIWVKASSFAILLAFSTSALAQKKEAKPIPKSEAGKDTPQKPANTSTPLNISELKDISRAAGVHQERLNSLNRLSEDELIEACIKLDFGDETIKLFSQQYRQDEIEYSKMLKAGYGKNHPRMVGLRKQIGEERKILLKASENYRQSLAIIIKNLENKLKEMEQAAK